VKSNPADLGLAGAVWMKGADAEAVPGTGTCAGQMENIYLTVVVVATLSYPDDNFSFPIENESLLCRRPISGSAVFLYRQEENHAALKHHRERERASGICRLRYHGAGRQVRNGTIPSGRRPHQGKQPKVYTDHAALFPEGSGPLYASKALCFKRLYKTILEEDMSIDVVSCGEIRTALGAGFPPERMYFHGNNKTDKEIEFAIDAGVGYFVVDNYEELQAISNYAQEKMIRQKF
jgi:hypothetical protein